MKRMLLALIIVSISILVCNIDFLPWWSYLVPCVFLGFVFEKMNIATHLFLIGFSSGFILWLGATLYFQATFSGEILNKVCVFLNLNIYLFLFLIGIIGGVLTGLSIHAGELLSQVFVKKHPNNEL